MARPVAVGGGGVLLQARAEPVVLAARRGPPGDPAAADRPWDHAARLGAAAGDPALPVRRGVPGDRPGGRPRPRARARRRTRSVEGLRRRFVLRVRADPARADDGARAGVTFPLRSLAAAALIAVGSPACTSAGGGPSPLPSHTRTFQVTYSVVG